MQKVIDWIEKEVARLNMVIEGKADAAEPEQAPDVLRTSLAE